MIKPNWPAPKNISAFTTTKANNLNLQLESNRLKLIDIFSLPSDPIWLKQVHSNRVIDLNKTPKNFEADASFTSKPNVICTAITADCLPILVCSKDGSEVAAIHAGWRGLSNAIIKNALNCMKSDRNNLLAWMGPAISQQYFEVGNDVREQFLAQNQQSVSAFQATKQAKWLADIYKIAVLELTRYGVLEIYGGKLCTYSDKEHFYSYRRDGKITGRIASLIWINSQN
ncbi:MAG: peptidoglycan editing factor PgeF [Gammaproteobacteria bacterium]|nr:peptidoglycan editing factor PgeF [Gammaproteobacteria bacterium]